jgi:hypothetical protein
MERMSTPRRETFAKRLSLAMLLGGLILVSALAPWGAQAAGPANNISVVAPADIHPNALALDSAGNPLIAFRGDEEIDLRLAHCNDPACAGGDETISAPDEDYFTGRSISMTLDHDGFPVISEFMEDYNQLRIARCTSFPCWGNVAVVETDVYVPNTSIAIDEANNPVVAYSGLKILHCNDPLCAGQNDSITVPETGGGFPSLKLDGAGNPVVSYSTSGELRLLHCNDPLCSGGGESITSPDESGGEALLTVLTLDTSGSPVVAFRDLAGSIKVLRCNDPNCAAPGEVTVTLPTPPAISFAFTTDAAGRPVVAYIDQASLNLNVLRCNDAACSSTGEATVTADADADTLALPSLVLDASGRPVVSYFDGTNWEIKLLRCSSLTCGAKGVNADNDACTDDQEFSVSASQGGLRDYTNFWDFFDTPDSSNDRDQSVAGTDFFRVLQRFGASDTGPGTFDRFSDPLSAPNAWVMGAHRANYHPAFDRGTSSGPNAWNLEAADGSIAGTDFFAILAQFGHSCG